MKQTWRWYGPNDPVTLEHALQAGATGIVTALHQIPNGEVWPVEEILKIKNMILRKGLEWSVVESVPVHEDIKMRNGNFKQLIFNYQQTIRNLSLCNIKIICYNFMPVLDWLRTDLEYVLPNGAKTLLFDYTAIAAFDLYILKRESAQQNYTERRKRLAYEYFKKMSSLEKNILCNSICAGLPGAEEKYTLERLKHRLEFYKDIKKNQFQENMAEFLTSICPIAEEEGVRLALHPDDPPYSIFGLPRIVSTIEDIGKIKNMFDGTSNGFTLCTGSYSALPENDLLKMVEKIKERIHFLHLRSVHIEKPKRFYEASHLEGTFDMVTLVEEILKEELSRKKGNLSFPIIPFRPDHGHQILGDIKKKINPGYSAIGRLKGISEIRGLQLAIKTLKYPELL